MSRGLAGLRRADGTPPTLRCWAVGMGYQTLDPRQHSRRLVPAGKLRSARGPSGSGIPIPTAPAASCGGVPSASKAPLEPRRHQALRPGALGRPATQELIPGSGTMVPDRVHRSTRRHRRSFRSIPGIWFEGLKGSLRPPGRSRSRRHLWYTRLRRSTCRKCRRRRLNTCGQLHRVALGRTRYGNSTQ